jgi:hypothetical protein
MLFTDPLFLFVFLPCVHALWLLLGIARAREATLLLALIASSFLFYSRFESQQRFSECADWVRSRRWQFFDPDHLNAERAVFVRASCRSYQRPYRSRNPASGELI